MAKHLVLRTPGDPLAVVGHRGSSGTRPENTMPAFAEAWRSGAPWLETDTQPAADGVPILFHDDTLDRTTDGSGSVRDQSSAALQRLDAGSWFAPEYARTPVPLLRDLLDALPERNYVALEIKGAHSPTETATLLRLVSDHPRGDQVLFESFERDVLAELHRIAPTRPLGLITAQWDADPVATCAAYGAITYNPHYALLKDQHSEVARLHEHDIAVAPWTVDDPDDWRWLDDLGVDAITTNRPADLLDWTARQVTPS